MQFHGSEILESDKVYDLVFGWGTVVDIDEVRKGFRVQFGTIKLFFNTDGKTPALSNPTLFWANPIHGIKPDKELKHWPAFIATASTLSAELLKLRNVK